MNPIKRILLKICLKKFLCLSAIYSHLFLLMKLSFCKKNVWKIFLGTLIEKFCHDMEQKFCNSLLLRSQNDITIYLEFVYCVGEFEFNAQFACSKNYFNWLYWWKVLIDAHFAVPNRRVTRKEFMRQKSFFFRKILLNNLRKKKPPMIFKDL